MRTLRIFFAVLCLVTLAACYGARRASNEQTYPANSGASNTIAEKEAKGPPKGQLNDSYQRVSLQQADQAQPVAQAMDRKLIKDADLTLEVNSPLDTQRQVASIAEARGGFVVTSETKQRQSDDSSQQVVDVALIIRVPSSQFGATKDEILKLGNRILDSKDTTQDVTEEFIDLEARAKTQKALEAQFLEIMKRANKVEDALEVQRQIAEVRTEIEKLEGRKRFLDNRSSLSTINVSLRSPSTIVVNPTGFARDVKDAVRESVEVARGIVLFLIRFVIVMIPIGLFILLPLGLIVRYLLRRARRLRTAGGLVVETPVQPA